MEYREYCPRTLTLFALVVFPNFRKVTACPPETGRDRPEFLQLTRIACLENALLSKLRPTRPRRLADVLIALEKNATLSDTRLRDLRSSINRVARRTCAHPARSACDKRKTGRLHAGCCRSTDQDLCQCPLEFPRSGKSERDKASWVREACP